MSALGDAIAAWRRLPEAERDDLRDCMLEEIREWRASLSAEDSATLESWIRVNEAAIALLEAAARAPVGIAPPLDRIKEAARRAARGRAA